MSAPKESSILDELTANIMGRKDEKATRLTPVGLERNAPLRMPDLPTVFMPQEQIETNVREVRHYAEKLLEICDQIDVSLGKEPGADGRYESTEMKAKAIIKAAELASEAAHAARLHAAQEGDAEAFPERFERLSAAAQAATFTDLDDEPEPTASDWKCPEHHRDDDMFIALNTSRSGRNYRSCTVANCGKFEK